MIFIEINGILINLDNVKRISPVTSEYDKDIIKFTHIDFTDGSYISCDATYYNKLKNYIKPIKFCKDDQERFSNGN